MQQIKTFLEINVSQNIILHLYTMFQKCGFNNKKVPKLRESP